MTAPAVSSNPQDERRELLAQIDDWLETPMFILGLAWLALLVVELTRGLTPLLETIGQVIWIVFLVDFAIRLLLAPEKSAYLRRNWLTAVSLGLPALRVFRIVRVFRVARGLRLVRLITSLNRGMRALGAAMERRGFGYVIALTLVVTLAGAAGMYAFENGHGLNDYGTALWWTSMIMATMGSDYWPQTAEGRVLCLLLALYAFAVFGYVTATIATFFIGRDAADPAAEVAGEETLRALRDEMAALRAEVRLLRESGYTRAESCSPESSLPPSLPSSTPPPSPASPR
jgi:voltage-gated potassium channel